MRALIVWSGTPVGDRTVSPLFCLTGSLADPSYAQRLNELVAPGDVLGPTLGARLSSLAAR
jgi:hypothetical protein